MPTPSDSILNLPKIFSWAHAREQEILRTLNTNSSGFLPLSGPAARQMTILFLTSTIDHLEQISKFRGLLRSCDNKANVVNNPEIVETLGHMVADCRQGLAKLNDLEYVQVDFLSAIKAELRSASWYLYELCEQWRDTKPALQFLLLGGEEALNRVYNGKIPGKVKTTAAYEIVILGAKHPNMAAKFKERRPLAISNDMMSDARAAIRKIDAGAAFNFARGYHYSGVCDGVDAFVGGTQVFTSLKGRIKGPASKGKKPRRKKRKTK